MKPWVCEFCGWDNYQSFRIAAREPECVRCGNPRGSKDARIKALRIEVKALSNEDRSLSRKLENIQGEINSLEDEISSLKGDYDDILNERGDVIEHMISQKAELVRLESIDIRVRIIAPDQRRLIEGEEKV